MAAASAAIVTSTSVVARGGAHALRATAPITAKEFGCPSARAIRSSSDSRSPAAIAPKWAWSFGDAVLMAAPILPVRLAARPVGYPRKRTSRRRGAKPITPPERGATGSAGASFGKRSSSVCSATRASMRASREPRQ